MAPSKLPQWLSNYLADSYLLSALKTLASREEERELARHLSVRHNPESDHPIPTSHCVRALKHIFRSAVSSDNITPTMDSREHYSVAIGRSPNNQARNRYMDIHPYDRTRVVINNDTGAHMANENAFENKGKYLNASWVLERYGHKWWIASQAPLPNTAHTFLSIFGQYTSPPESAYTHNASSEPKSRVRTVVQLTNEIEGGRRKAHPYFPDSVGKSTIVNPDRGDENPAFKVTLVNREIIETAHCVLSTILITPVTTSTTPSHGPDSSHTEPIASANAENRGDDAEGDSMEEIKGSIIFRHMLYTAWPDHGVPKASNRASLLAFLRLVDSTNRDISFARRPDDPELDLDPPIIVGCSAGIGRTGSFIALSSLLRKFGLLPPPGIPSDPSALPPSPLGPVPLALSDDLVVQEIDSLREQRPRMVERNEQVILIYEMLTFALTV